MSGSRALRLACTLLVCFAATLGAAVPAAAQKLNSNEPVNIEADRMKADDQKQIAEFEGRVVLTQGTFQLRADKLIVRKDDEGFQHGTAIGQPATFRQKREGTDEWISGEAKRIEYDGRLEKVELFDNARVARDNDEVRGNYISYDTRAQVFRVQGGKEYAGAPGRDGRVRAVIQPRGKAASGGKPAAPLQLAPSAGIGPNDQ